jgi:hypothetical protein
VSLRLLSLGIIVRRTSLFLKDLSERITALHNAWSPILAAIFAGNGVVLKCSENVIWSTTWFVQAIKEALRVCGHDEDLVQVHLIFLSISMV